ncbi:MAG TPA: class I SAM-dependent methyltransferase [Verrucomicrobiae bacterium]|jgi:SAM-dependent methyltransferase|nr:class I SAM-dependent methyltransferase [Verrucomicrobiae bacterium]
MKTRGNFQGMLTIARFNWPLYAAALAVLIAAGVGIFLSAGLLKILCAITVASAAYFIFFSLGVSHLVYDRSDLYRWSWLDRAVHGAVVRQAIFCHSGFDETSAELREKFNHAQWSILDHYDAERMTEPSIHRARALFPPTAGTLACHHDAWPLADDFADVIFALFAIHELRTESERTAWFAEAHRCLRKGGRVVLVEHLRDAANFLAFGPGFLHFHSRASWRRCWERAGLQSIEHCSVTPFVQVFVLAAQ